MGRHGGNMAEAGAVGWMFSRKGPIIVPKEPASEDKMLRSCWMRARKICAMMVRRGKFCAPPE